MRLEARRQGTEFGVACRAEEIPDQDDQLLAPGLVFVEGFERDLLSVLVLDQEFTGFLERLGIWELVVALFFLAFAVLFV